MRQDRGQDLGGYEARLWPRSTGILGKIMAKIYEDMRQDDDQDLGDRSWTRSYT